MKQEHVSDPLAVKFGPSIGGVRQGENWIPDNGPEIWAAATVVESEPQTPIAQECDTPHETLPTDPNARYYDAGGIETIEIIRAKLTPEQFIGYLMGCKLKYLCRANYKGCFNSDIHKASIYAQMLKEVSK